jgi:nitroimidazol reductase NimA-like FMN-containing flavoprotein (pyridoxamine 5'-phosphate oxidase superfamily)
MQDFAVPSLDVLARDECLTLLATTPIGRLVFTEQALPAVRLVNFALHGNEIVIRMGEGNKLLSAVRHAVVAFEADEVDRRTRTGWRVTVIGHARQVTDPAESARLRELLPASWAPGPREHLICVGIELVSGRRLDNVLPAEELT